MLMLSKAATSFIQIGLVIARDETFCNKVGTGKFTSEIVVVEI
jgi:hypothetical protein